MRFLIPLALAAALPVGAQTMYRCGSSFSDHPCVPGQVPVVTAPAVRPVDPPVSQEVEDAAKAACVARLTRDIQFRDADSVKVLGVQRRGILRGDGSTPPTRVYQMSVNAKNAYGGYTGPKEYFCHTDPANERTVLLVVPTGY